VAILTAPQLPLRPTLNFAGAFIRKSVELRLMKSCFSSATPWFLTALNMSRVNAQRNHIPLDTYDAELED